ncbi:rust resistance kinase Lr10-like [Neltuma alba]|uniref:rust resistance kinase Lr10-like n=1 Tax=Neltuma alba TaxID=207710 RepID=UPI0010A40148|nr:rust resistance kinase Lr10-like [Prosopis alba]XP_028788044.1 rust resistance kinase Lr10-like [Prosopis alba]
MIKQDSKSFWRIMMHSSPRFSYADIKRITNHFKNKLGEGAHGTVFKGKLSTDIQVAVKVLNNSEMTVRASCMKWEPWAKFITSTLFVCWAFVLTVFIVLLFEFFSNGSLQKFISSPDDKENFLGWSKLQEKALSIAKGIEYLHQGCDYRILHFDINPRNVLLDQNLSPKISHLGLAKLCPKNQNTVSMTAARGTLGYIALEVFSRNFENVSYKPDIYSYRILLLEMVGGRRNVNTNQQTFRVLYPSWIHNLIEGGDVSMYIEDEFEIRTAKKLAIVGLSCIQWYPISGPSMKTVIHMLEGEVDELKVPPTLFDFTTSTTTSIIVPARHLNSDLDVIHELE